MSITVSASVCFSVVVVFFLVVVGFFVVGAAVVVSFSVVVCASVCVVLCTSFAFGIRSNRLIQNAAARTAIRIRKTAAVI